MTGFAQEAVSLLELFQNLAQKIFKAQSDEAVPIVVIFLEDVRHTFQGDAALHEKVKAHDTLVALVVRPEEQLDKLRAEPITEGYQGVGELLEGDVAATVDVEAVKEGAPRGKERPKTAELIKVDGAVAIRIKHSNHHPDCLDVKGRPVTVDESSGKLSLRQLSRS